MMTDDVKPGWPEPTPAAPATPSTDMTPIPDLPTAVDESGAQEQLTIRFHGTRKQFRRMLGRDLLLMFVTLGVYWFWSRTNVRRFIWSHLSLGGSRLEYGGRGIELFVGFVIAGILLALSFWGLRFLVVSLAGPQFGPIVWIFALYLLLAILGLLAIYRRHRYMVRRTSWRGINCGQTGSTAGYVGRIALPLIAAILTLGMAIPLVTVAMQRYLIGNMSVGSQAFVYQGQARDIFGRWIVCWLLIPFTGGISLFWWKGFTTRYQLLQTSLGGLRFSSSLRPMHVVGIYIFGGLLAGLVVYGLLALLAGAFYILAASTNVDEGIGTYGIESVRTYGIWLSVLSPLLFLPLFGPVSYAAYLYFVDYRFVEYVFETTEIVGTMDVSEIVQAHDRAHGPGDGLDAILSMDGI